MALAARLLGLQCTARGAQGALGDLSVSFEGERSTRTRASGGAESAWVACLFQ